MIHSQAETFYRIGTIPRSWIRYRPDIWIYFTGGLTKAPFMIHISTLIHTYRGNIYLFCQIVWRRVIFQTWIDTAGAKKCLKLVYFALFLKSFPCNGLKHHNNYDSRVQSGRETTLKNNPHVYHSRAFFILWDLNVTFL